jgi:hypothetical protein
VASALAAAAHRRRTVAIPISAGAEPPEPEVAVATGLERGSRVPQVSGEHIALAGYAYMAGAKRGVRLRGRAPLCEAGAHVHAMI